MNLGFLRELTVLFLAEVVGTALLLFLGCISSVKLIPTSSSYESICISFGMAVGMIVQIFGHISAAHLNPAVTLGSFILGEMKNNLYVPAYFAAQFLGALIGFGTLALVSPSHVFFPPRPEGGNVTVAGFCSTVPNQITAWQALIVEFVLTMTLVLVCAGVWDTRNKQKLDSIPVKFAFAITGLSLCAGQYTGASMNPARTLAPAIINGDWKDHWVYWVGPMSGSAVAAGGYRLIFWDRESRRQYMSQLSAPPQT